MLPEISSYLTDEVMDKIKSQSVHIMRMYESEEIGDMMVQLSCEWFLKGIIEGKKNE